VELWRQRALDAADGDPRTAIPALAALARVGGRDAPHRSEGEGPDPILQREVLDALARVDWQSLDDALRQDLLRATSLAITRLGESGEPVMTEPAARAALISAWSPRFPSGSPRVDVALCELLVSLQDPRLAARAVEQLHAAPTQEEQLDYARCLRRLDAGWTPELRRRYAGWFSRASAYHGGASFAGYVRSIQADAAARLSGDQREAFLEWTAGAGPGTSPLSAMQLPLGGTRTAHPWTAAELLPIVQASLAEDAPVRDLARGRMLFGAAGCFACHRVAGEGGIVGPDLTGAAGRFALADLLDAVIDPSSTVSDQYERSNLHLRDGEVLTGRIVNLSGSRIDVSTDLFRPGDVVSVDRAELESITPSTVSSMPEGLIDLLDEAEIADLMAWLLSAR
jgi:putative heme-binding domain-containing protein